RVTGFSEAPSEMLRKLGIKAPDRWKAGDSRATNTILKHKENGFRVRATRQVADFEERVKRLVVKVYPFKSQLAELKADCQLACVFYLSGSERPVVFFSKEVLARLAELEASIDVDFYYLGEEAA